MGDLLGGVCMWLGEGGGGWCWVSFWGFLRLGSGGVGSLCGGFEAGELGRGW